MKENQLYFCESCDKTIKLKSKSKHLNSNSHKHKEKYLTVVKKYEFIRPEIDGVNYKLNDNKKV